jgi:hypothetical protein
LNIQHDGHASLCPSYGLATGGAHPEDAERRSGATNGMPAAPPGEPEIYWNQEPSQPDPPVG